MYDTSPLIIRSSHFLGTCAALVVCAGALTTLLGCCCCVYDEEGRDPGLEYELELEEAELVPPAPLECGGGAQLSRPRDARIGSSKALVGKQLTVVVFVQPEQGAAWTPDKVAAAKGAVAVAHRYLEAEAARYGHALTMEAIYELEQAPHEDARLGSTDWSGTQEVKEDVLARLAGKRRKGAWRDALQRKHGADGVHLLLFNAESGRAFAQNEHDPNTDWTLLYDEGVIAQAAPVIAHEVLHLYGAHDLYNEPELKRALRGVLDIATRDKVAAIWPGELMLSVTPAEQVRQYVGPYTAWLVGWSECTEPHFRDYRDGQQYPQW